MQIAPSVFLLPCDADLRTEKTAVASGVPASSLTSMLSSVPASVLINTYDMCRNDPRRGSKAESRNVLREVQIRELTMTAGRTQTPEEPGVVTTLLASSTGPRSWEWPGRRRGIFSACLEDGLRRGAADSQGTVRLQALLSYLGKAVTGVSNREIGESQDPRVEISGPVGFDVVLATGVTPGSSGATAVVDNATSVQERYDAAFQRGSELFKEKRYAAALERLREAAEIKPTARAIGLQGRCEYELNHVANARKLYTEALNIDPQMIAGYLVLGYLALADKDYRAALALFDKALELDDKSVHALRHSGDCHYFMADYAKAALYYERAIAILPSDATVQYDYAVSLMNCKRLKESDAAWQRLTELDPKQSTGFTYRGVIRASHWNQPAQAVPFFVKALTINPKDQLAARDLGWIRHQQKDDSAAQKLLTTATTVDPKDATAWNRLGIVYGDRGNPKKEEECYRKAIQLEPGDGVYWANLASSLLDQDRRSVAITPVRRGFS